MPRPSRKTKPASKASSATIKAASKQINKDTDDKENTSSSTKKLKHTLRSSTPQQTTPQSNKRVMPAGTMYSTPPKRLTLESPRSATPKSLYGKRKLATHRLSSSGGRRLSGGFIGDDDPIFDSFNDDISPISKNGPLEELDERSLSFNNSPLSLRKSSRIQSSIKNDSGKNEMTEADTLPSIELLFEGARSSFDENPQSTIENMKESSNSDGTDTEIFDIDKLVTDIHKKQGQVRSSQNKTESKLTPSVIDKDTRSSKDDIGALIPKRTRTRQAQKSGSVKKNKTKSPKSKTKAIEDDGMNVSDENSEGEKDHDWKPRKGRTRGVSKTRQPSKVSKDKRQTYGKKVHHTTTDAATASSVRPSTWSVDPSLSRYFQDIDNFKLSEEAI